MQRKTFLLATSWLALSIASVGAQATTQKSPDSPEIQYLRRLIAEQQKNPDKVLRTLPRTNAPAVTSTTATNRTVIEKAKATPTKTAAPEAAKSSSPKTAQPVRARETTNAVPTPAEAARQQKISEVEARLDEMLRQKEAREKAALTNATPTKTATPATPQTKRQRLDALLKQMIDGKISGAEYTEKREKIVAEPD